MYPYYELCSWTVLLSNYIFTVQVDSIVILLFTVQVDSTTVLSRCLLPLRTTTGRTTK